MHLGLGLLLLTAAAAAATPWPTPGQLPRPPADRPGPVRVAVLSHVNVPNFGDRLGYHVLTGVLPADAVVEHFGLETCDAGMCPPALPRMGDFDVLVVGTGASIFARTVTPELLALVDAAPVAIGIFGTQYHELLAPGQMEALVGRLDLWLARYRDDVRRFGAANPRSVYLGDWLVDMCPLSMWRDNTVFEVQPSVQEHEVPLDRVIQQIQEARFVNSSRLHPLLCALPSAEQVCFREQREMGSDAVASGKFAAMLADVFPGAPSPFPENEFFAVDKAAVARYKREVRGRMDRVRELFASWLTRPAAAEQPAKAPLAARSPPVVRVGWEPWADYKAAADRYNAGVQLWHEERLRDAKAEFEAAIALSPTLGPPRMQLGVLLGLLGRAEEAVESVRAAVDVGGAEEPRATSVLQDFAQQMELADEAAAIGAMHHELRVAGIESPLLSAAPLLTAAELADVARLYRGAGRKAELLELLAGHARALGDSPEAAAAATARLSVAQRALGRPKKADASLRRALAMDPACPLALAQTAAHSGDALSAAMAALSAGGRGPELDEVLREALMELSEGA